MFSYVFPKIVAVYENVEKYGTAGQAADDNMAYAHCMSDN